MVRRGFDAEGADDAHALAERDGQRRKGGPASKQKHGGVAGGIGIGQPDLFSRLVFEPAQHGGVQHSHTQRGAQARDEPVDIAVAMRERNGVIGKRASGFDDDQRKIRASRRDLLGKRCQTGFGPIEHRGKDDAGLHLRDGARSVDPARLDHRKHLRFIERCHKGRPPIAGDDEDGALLRHLTNSVHVRGGNVES